MINKVSPEATLRIIKKLSTAFEAKHKVYSNPMFKSVFIPMFSNLDSVYTLAYGDFNGLNKFNGLYGNDAGTQAMVNSIGIIQDHLPDDTVTIRIAGDEFVFLVPDLTADEVEPHLVDSLAVLASHPDSALTMSFGVVDSNETPSIFDMYAIAENRENIAKLNSRTAEYSKEEVEKKLNEAFAKFFDNYRFSNKMELKSEHIVELGKMAMSSALDLIASSEFRTLHLPRKGTAQFSSLFTPSVPLFTPAQAEEVFEYFKAPESSDEEVSQLASTLYSTQINKLFQEIIVNPNSGFYNNVYYETFFKDLIPKDTYRPATAILLDVTGIKDCNAKMSHLETDQRLAELAATISGSLSSTLGKDFDTNIGSFDEKENYIFNLFAGNFLVLLGDRTLSDREMMDFLSDLKSVNISPMHVLSSYTNSQDKTYEQMVQSLEADVLDKKTRQLEQNITSPETRESFDLFISDAVDFFMKKCPTASDLKTQRTFLQYLSNSLVREAIKSNNEYAHKHPQTQSRDD